MILMSAVQLIALMLQQKYRLTYKTCTTFFRSLLNSNICRYRHWGQASPWLASINPRDELMPIDGDDGVFPTTGNELVRSSFLLCFFDLTDHMNNCPYVQKPEVVDSNRKYRVRVLVCAPSNSALDEIVLRLLSTGRFYFLIIYNYACFV